MAQPQPPETTRSGDRSPWPGRIAGIIVLIAIIAIALGVYLPRARQEGEPIPQDIAQPGPEVQQPTQSVAQIPQQVIESAPQRAPEQPTESPQQPIQNQQPNPAQQAVANQSQQEQIQAPREGYQLPSSQSPTTIRRQAPSQSQADGQAASQAANQSTNSSQSASRAPAQSAQPSRAAASSPARSSAPAPSPAPQPAPQARQPQQQRPAPQPRPAYTPQQAQQMVRQIEAAERGARWQALRFFIAELQKPMYQDEDFWPIMQTAMATQGMAAIPGGPTQGHSEILAVLANAPSGKAAAAQLQKMGHQSALSTAVQQQLVRVLATATDYHSCINGLKQVLQSNRIQLADTTNQQLDSAVTKAFQNQAAMRQMYGRQ